MHRSPAPHAALLVAALLSLSAAVSQARIVDATDPLQAGREALGRGDGPAAVSMLESALLSVSANDRAAVLDDLRLAYERAAAQAEAAGDARRARSYRENLLIIDRSRDVSGAAGGGVPTPVYPNTVVPPAPIPPHSPPAAPPAVERPANVEPASNASSSAESVGGRPGEAARRPSETMPPIDEAVGPASNPEHDQPPQSSPVEPVPSRPPTPIPGQAVADPPPPGELLRTADTSFRAKNYDEAGRIYSGLEARGQLPEAHRPVWAYCRFVALVRRINAQPSSPAEWSAIHAEIRAIRALTPPEIWFGDYLQDLATERAVASGAKPSAFIVRGQSEAQNPTSTGRPASPSGSWQVMETENFRLFHADPVLADRIARQAERARSELLRYWTGSEPSSPWSPRCDLYVYPDATIFSRVTGQPADSPGFSTMGLSGGRVVARRINVRADHEGLVEAVVPHEVAHVVLADLFPTQQIPRWADEGIAVLAEPSEAQASRLSHLDGPLASGRVFRSGQLMTASMPDGRYWDLFMAQSASLARYLIQLDSPDRLVSFLRESERIGVEAALRRVYGFEDFDDLHARWLAHSRRSSVAAASAIATRPVDSQPSR